MQQSSLLLQKTSGGETAAGMDAEHSGYRCCQSSAAKYASAFAVHPQSTRGSHRYVPVTLGHTDHSQESVRTFRASRQANEMWLRQCCQSASSCSIHAATTGVWRVSQLQPSACVCACVCVWASVCLSDIHHPAYRPHADCWMRAVYNLCSGLSLWVFRTASPQWKR